MFFTRQTFAAIKHIQREDSQTHKLGRFSFISGRLTMMLVMMMMIFYLSMKPMPHSSPKSRVLWSFSPNLCMINLDAQG